MGGVRGGGFLSNPPSPPPPPLLIHVALCIDTCNYFAHSFEGDVAKPRLFHIVFIFIGVNSTQLLEKCKFTKYL